ncbi:uncharacterized protein DS421_18g609900 [Arachis hypogaea]|nr:uncharacterized protein DS421_18g609900 [Arachis hypogaea]
MCYRKFFDTFGDSIQKCIHSVRFAPGDRSSNSYGERGGLDKREGTANALRKQAHEAPGNHAFLPGWAQGQQSAASPVVVSSFLTDPIGTNGEPLNLEVGLEERAVQERGDIAIGERFCNLRLVTLFADLLKDSLAPRPPKVGNLRQHLNAERRPPIQLPCLPALTVAAYRYRWKVACFSSPRRLPAHVIREEKAASGSSLSRATGRRLLSEGLRRRKRGSPLLFSLKACFRKLGEKGLVKNL